MTTPDQNEARREAIQSLGDVISELPGILHPYNTATAVYAAGWRPPLSTPEASDDERYEDSADYAGSVEWLRELGVVPVAAKMFLDDVIKSARRSPVPADTPSDDEREARNAARRMLSRALDGRLLDEVEAMMWATGYRRSPVPADTPSEGEVLVEGSWFKRTGLPEVLGNFMRSSAEHAREAKDLLVALTELRPVREADTIALASRPTPPEDVERVADLIRDGIRGERDDTSICVPVGDLKVLLAALAAVPADGETEWAESLVNDGMHEFTVSSDCDGTNEKRWMRTPRRVIKAGPWLPIPEGSAD